MESDMKRKINIKAQFKNIFSFSIREHYGTIL